MTRPAALPAERRPSAGNAPRSEIEILGYRLLVVAPAAVLGPLRQRLATPTACIDSGVAGYATSIRVSVPFEGAEFYRVEHDASPAVDVPRVSIVRHLEWLVHAVAIRRLARRFLLLHAGGVAFKGAGMILSAASGSGKSTLTAALVAAGFIYLSDEVATIEPHTLALQPYPRNLCVKTGSLPVLAPLYPELAGAEPELRSDGEAVWYLRPPDERWQGTPVPVRHIIFPTYIPGARTTLRQVPRASAFEQLSTQSFSGNALGERTAGVLAGLVARSDCFELQVGSLEAGVATLERLAAS